MKETKMKFAIACAAAAAVCFTSAVATAQCSTCAVPYAAASPVVYNNYTSYEGWYLGKYLGRLGSRIFGPAPAPAYTAAYPATYAAGYAPSYGYATSYAPSYNYAASYAPSYNYASYAPTCNTCGTSPCCCSQTTYRPVVMQPVDTCNSCCQPTCSTCNTCPTCTSGVSQATYDAPLTSSCPTCSTSTYLESPSASAPSLNTAPPQTFRETDRIDPIPANESSNAGQANDLDAPSLFDPNDKLTKQPTASVWTAVYKQPATITTISTQQPVTSKQSIGWKSGK